MKRILIYGGCHAQVIRDLLSRILPSDEFDLSLLINFRLIGSGMPFPYADLQRFDTLIYSPIENHGSYNTDALREACAAVGCETICYPWLEWHGYCPGAQKGVFKGRHQWHYPQLQALAETFNSFESFYRHVVDHFPDEKSVRQIFDTSFAMVRAAEERHGMEVRVSDFIAEEFRSSRLFLISDHPSVKVYERVIAQILAALKLPMDVALGSEEPQGQLRTPIFPRVAEQLGLRFSDSEWVDEELSPGLRGDLRTYLRLYYYPGGVILGPLDNARIFSRTASGSRIDLAAGLETRLFAQAAKKNARNTLVDYELLEVLDGPDLATGTLKTFSIDPNEWRSTWIF